MALKWYDHIHHKQHDHTHRISHISVVEECIKYRVLSQHRVIVRTGVTTLDSYTINCTHTEGGRDR